MTRRALPRVASARPVIAWSLFLVGTLLVLASIVRLSADGVLMLGAVALLVWAYLIGAFTAEFWDRHR